MTARIATGPRPDTWTCPRLGLTSGEVTPSKAVGTSWEAEPAELAEPRGRRNRLGLRGPWAWRGPLGLAEPARCTEPAGPAEPARSAGLTKLVGTAVIDAARAALATQGWAVIQGIATDPGERVHDALLDLAAGFGRPSTRDGGTAVWPVTARSRGAMATFSLRTGAAALHTDAQYRRVPEDLVCLFAVRRAADGGATRLLSACDAVAAVRRHPLGAQVLARLGRPVWNWATPEPFATEPAFRAAVLPGDGTVRWRPDNLSCSVGPRARAVAKLFTDLVEAAPVVTEFMLASGDMVIIDNRRALHGRTAFTDRRRLLLRVRLWADR